MENTNTGLWMFGTGGNGLWGSSSRRGLTWAEATMTWAELTETWEELEP